MPMHASAAIPLSPGGKGDYQALLRPLFMLSFLVDDFLTENDFFGAQCVMLSSASSKTAIGLVHLLHSGRKSPVIGLTSAGNAGFVASLGCYDDVVTYDRMTSLPQDAGRARRHGRQQRAAREAAPPFRRADEIFGPYRIHASRYRSRRPALPGAKPRWFFAPDQIRKRANEWGPGGMERVSAQRGRILPRPGAMPDRGREPRPGGGEAGLSRHAEGTYSA